MKSENSVKADHYWGAERREFRKSGYTSIGELICNLEEHVATQQRLISALQKTPDDPAQVMLLEYIETRSTTKTAKFMRDRGFLNPAGNSFLPSDVSEFIKVGHESLDPVLLEYARQIFSSNLKGVSRSYF